MNLIANSDILRPGERLEARSSRSDFLWVRFTLVFVVDECSMVAQEFLMAGVRIPNLNNELLDAGSQLTGYSKNHMIRATTAGLRF